MNNHDTITLREFTSPFFWVTALLFVLLALVPIFDHRFADPVSSGDPIENRTEEKSLVTE